MVETVWAPVAIVGEPAADLSKKGSKRSLIVEVAGPAGAGKSTAVRALLARDPRIHIVPLLPRADLAPLYARRAAALLPTYLRGYWRTRWFTKPEAKAMALVDGWRRQVDRRPIDDDRILLFDQGPVFRLAVLSGLGPPITASPAFRNLMDSWTNAWAERLDVVVWLSAPGDVLLHRIRTRPQNHAVKEWLDGPALQRVGRYAAAIERTIQEVAGSSILVLRFDTALRSPDSIADEVLATLREGRKARG